MIKALVKKDEKALKGRTDEVRWVRKKSVFDVRVTSAGTEVYSQFHLTKSRRR